MAMTFGEALDAGNYCQIDACDDCAIAQVNGDYTGMDEDRADEVRAAWARIGADADITYGVAEHVEGCDPRSDVGCVCGRIEFTYSACDVCGAGGGSRHSFLLVYGIRA